MVANKSARPHRLTIGGLDFSPALIEYSGSDNPIDSSGLIIHTGTIRLRTVQGLPESLDDRTNLTGWGIGQTLTLEVNNSLGHLQRHPRGALRILSSEFDPIDQILTLRIGCLLALLNFREPTDPDKAEIQPGRTITRQDVVANLLRAAGINNFNLPNLPYLTA